MEKEDLRKSAEIPYPVSKIITGPEKLFDKTSLYEARKKGLIKFYYFGCKPYIYMSDINAVMTDKPQTLK